VKWEAAKAMKRMTSTEIRGCSRSCSTYKNTKETATTAKASRASIAVSAMIAANRNSANCCLHDHGALFGEKRRVYR
jgi:hypothetical protein